MWIEPVILSGTDGIITVFNLLVGLNAAEFKKDLIFIIIFIAIVGDSISMAISYLNSKLKDTNDLVTTQIVLESLYNIMSFVFFGTLCLLIYFMITNEPNVKNAYIAIIIPLLLLGLLQMKYRDGNVSFVVSLILGLLGSFLSYAVGSILRFMK